MHAVLAIRLRGRASFRAGPDLLRPHSASFHPCVRRRNRVSEVDASVISGSTMSSSWTPSCVIHDVFAPANGTHSTWNQHMEPPVQHSPELCLELDTVVAQAALVLSSTWSHTRDDRAFPKPRSHCPPRVRARTFGTAGTPHRLGAPAATLGAF